MSRSRKPWRFTQAAIIVIALGLVAATWIGTYNAMLAERREARARVEANLSNQALLFEEELRRQLLAIEQTMAILERNWERDPSGFSLPDWYDRAAVLTDVVLHVYITDETGIIRASTRPELIGSNVSDREYFQEAKAMPRDNGGLFIGPLTQGKVTQRWQMNMVRRLDGPDGKFAGVIGASYDTTSLTRFYERANLGKEGVIGLLGSGGMFRALAGPTAAPPGISIAGTELFNQIEENEDGLWLGPSVPDGHSRFLAFRHVPGRGLTVIVGYGQKEAMTASDSWQNAALIFASGITFVLLTLTAVLVRNVRTAHWREERLARDRQELETAYGLLELAKSRADAKAAQLEATLAGMSDGVSMVDADLRLVQWNPRFAEVTGLPLSLLRLGLPMEEMLRVQARGGEFGAVDVETEVARRMALLRATVDASTAERKRPDGSIIELRRRALRGGGFVTLYTDITARKQAEQALRRAREVAEQAAEEKSRFVAIVSHEVRTPLNALLNSLSILAEATVSPETERLAGIARQAGDALLGLLDDILEMSRMDAGRLVLRPASFELRPLLAGAIEMFHAQAAGRGVTLRFTVDAATPERVLADPIRLRQVLINLLSNAVKFSAPGIVTLAAGPQSGGSPPMLRLSITDQGPAISAADRERLFRPFSRIEQNGTATEAGSGLGLTICQRLMVLMGGEIGCCPTPDGGNAFWVTLPLLPAEGPSLLAKKASRRLLPRTRVLLVEDMRANRLVTAAMLRRAGHEVDLASSGEEAVRAVQLQPCDIVFMDLNMPGLGGIEATRKIRALGGLPGSVPVIALTGHLGAEDAAYCRSAGMQDVLCKPADEATLLGAIMRYVWLVPGTAASERPGRSEVPSGGPVLCSERLQELRGSLPPSGLRSLVDTCLADLREHLPLLRRGLAQGDARAIEGEAHAMAGVAATYGMQALERRLRAVLQAAQQGDARGALAKAGDLERELDDAERALRDALQPELV